MSLDLKVINFNVGGKKDMVRLMEMDKCQGNRAISLREISEEETTLKKGERRYISLATTFFKKMIEEHAPDIFTFQEFYSKSTEKKEIDQLIKDEGYRIRSSGDLALGYQSKRLEEINGSQIITPSQCSKKQEKPSILVKDLLHKNSKKIIRVVSSHLKGFDAKQQKIATQIVKGKITLSPINQHPLTEEEKNQWKDIKKNNPARGDFELKKALEEIEADTTSTNAPDLIIIGLDANTTNKFVENRLHPKRLKQLYEKGYICDENDIDSTIVDHALNQLTRYDYVYVKGIKEEGQVMICSQAYGPPADAYSQIMSDHRPVIADIQFKFPVQIDFEVLKMIETGIVKEEIK